MESIKPQTAFAYFLGFLIAFGSLFAGNLLGFIITAVWGWENIEYTRPAGSALSAIQGATGAAIALYASERWLGSCKFSDRWLGLFVWIASGLIAALIILSVFANRLDELLNWKSVATILNIGAIELTRRNLRNDLA